MCVSIVIFGFSALSAAPPTEDVLPPPQIVSPEIVLPPGDTPYILPYERINRLERWQYYGVDRMGTWRPRVAFSPYGAFYLYNGASYLYVPTHNRDFMSYVTD
jgi:hypothetical protein